MNWFIQVPDRVRKTIKNFPRKDQERILAAMRDFVFNPFTGDIAKIEEKENGWRRRVGNYRIFYNIKKEKKTVEITEVERRTSKTY